MLPKHSTALRQVALKHNVGYGKGTLECLPRIVAVAICASRPGFTQTSTRTSNGKRETREGKGANRAREPERTMGEAATVTEAGEKA